MLRCLCALAFLATVASAQGPQFFDIQGRLQQLKEQLGLNDSQMEKLQATYESMMQRMMDFRNNPSGGDFREQMRAMREEVEKELETYLTPEQLEGVRNAMNPGRGMARTREVNPEERDSRRLARALEELALAPEELEIVQPALEGLLAKKREAEAAARQKRDGLRQAVEANQPDAEIEKLLSELAAAEEAMGANVDPLEAELWDLLTARQRAILVQHGMVRPRRSGTSDY